MISFISRLSLLTCFVFLGALWSSVGAEYPQENYVIHITSIKPFPRVALQNHQNVTWVNDNDLIHSIVSDDGYFNSGDLLPKQSFTFFFNQSGTFFYHDGHYAEFMTGVVTVPEVNFSAETERSTEILPTPNPATDSKLEVFHHNFTTIYVEKNYTQLTVAYYDVVINSTAFVLNSSTDQIGSSTFLSLLFVLAGMLSGWLL